MRWWLASAYALHIKSPQPQRAFLLSGCSKIRDKHRVLKIVEEVKNEGIEVWRVVSR
jgi:hypothetical protein